MFGERITENPSPLSAHSKYEKNGVVVTVVVNVVVVVGVVVGVVVAVVAVQSWNMPCPQVYSSTILFN